MSSAGNEESIEITEQNSFKHSLFVLQSLVSKDFKLKYRRSILGVVWSVLNPLLMMVVLTAVFSYIFRFEILNFPVYLILGQILFNLMSAATSSGMTSIIDSSALIKKIRINKIVFPIEKVVSELVNFAIALVAVVLVLVYFYFFPNDTNPQIIPTFNILFLPVLLLYVFIFCTGLSLLLSALAVFFRDVIHLWGVIIIAWTYSTPIFYPVTLLAPWMQTLMQFNPMYHYITYFRDIVLWGNTPSITTNLICLGIAVVTFFAGLIVFRKTENKFILYV